MSWTDNREQGLTGRKRPCAPRSSQLQTSITMIIYPALTKCTVSMFHQRPVNRHCIGKFIGIGSQGQVGKAASHWCSKQERGKGEKNPSSAPLKEQFITKHLQETVCVACCYFFSFASVACLNEEWGCVNQFLAAGAHWHGPGQLFAALEATGPTEAGSRRGMPVSVSLLNSLQGIHGWDNLFLRELEISIWSNGNCNQRDSILICTH